MTVAAGTTRGSATGARCRASGRRTPSAGRWFRAACRDCTRGRPTTTEWAWASAATGCSAASASRTTARCRAAASCPCGAEAHSRSSTGRTARWRSTATCEARCSARATRKAGWSQVCRCRTAEALGSYAGVDNGRVTSAVTGLCPWIGYKASERVTVWTVAGYGAGGLMLNPSAGAPIETDLSMAMAARGGRGQILGGGGGGFGLAFKADALWVGMRTHAASGPSGNLESTRAGVSGCARRSKARRA